MPAFVLKINPTNGDIYVGGATTSSNLPGNKAGVIQAAYQGGICDGFYLPYQTTAPLLKKTTYFGTAGSDAIYGIEFDKNGISLCYGLHNGQTGQRHRNVGFINPGAKQFVAKLQPDLSAYVYSTTFGKACTHPNISPVAFLVDRCENVYVIGMGWMAFCEYRSLWTVWNCRDARYTQCN